MLLYRAGIDAATGRPLIGRAHLDQSISKIVTTVLTERVMRLDFGCALVRRIGRNMHAGLLLQIYSDVISAIHKFEPEARIRQASLVSIERTGGFGFGLAGFYFPEGRFGNYRDSQPMDLTLPVRAGGA